MKTGQKALKGIDTPFRTFRPEGAPGPFHGMGSVRPVYCMWVYGG